MLSKTPIFFPDCCADSYLLTKTVPQNDAAVSIMQIRSQRFCYLPNAKQSESRSSIGKQSMSFIVNTQKIWAESVCCGDIYRIDWFFGPYKDARLNLFYFRVTASYAIGCLRIAKRLLCMIHRMSDFMYGFTLQIQQLCLEYLLSMCLLLYWI